MADPENVLFVRKTGHNNTDNESDDVWDDSALIKAYDKAVNLAKEEVARRMGMEIQNSEPKPKVRSHKQTHQSQKTSKVERKWTEGSPCRAVYSEDGEVYEAIISKVYENTGTCIVKFIGYGNTEKVELSSLLQSEGLQNQIAQQKKAQAERCAVDNMNSVDSTYPFNEPKKPKAVQGEKMECDPEENRSFKKYFAPGPLTGSFQDLIPPAPPLPPQLMAKLPENDADALSSMLMSWYISGFHTGYYHGLKQAKSTQEKHGNC